METFRYYGALIVIVTVPPAVAFWFWIHPFARHWQKVGPRVTYTVALASMALLWAAIFRLRDVLLRVEYGFSLPLAILAGLFYLGAVVLEILCRRHLKLSILVGLPEVSPDSHPPRLLTEGIYGRVRHPRYLSFGFAMIAVALFTNYLAVYLLLLAAPPTIYLLVVVEERELRQRFGPAYERYTREVPRFLPRLVRRQSTARADR